METIIATIKPVHLGNIRRGVKLYEIRKTCPKEIPFKVLCCESGSGGQIKAEFVCDCVFMETVFHNPVRLEMACVSPDEALKYFKGEDVFFWRIKNMVDYCNTKGRKVRNISEFGLKRPPQSWQYVKDGAERKKMDRISENASRKEIINAVNYLIEIRNREVEARTKELEAEITFLKHQNKVNQAFCAYLEP